MPTSTNSVYFDLMKSKSSGRQVSEFWVASNGSLFGISRANQVQKYLLNPEYRSVKQ